MLGPSAIIAIVALEAGFWGLFSDPKQLGEATLIAIGAIIFGMIVHRLWPKSANPVLFGCLAAIGLVAVLAYLGVGSAGLVLWLMIGAAVVFGGLAIALGGF